MKIRIFFLVLIFVTFYGCEQNNVSKTHLMGESATKKETEVSQEKQKKISEKLELQKLIGENQIALAKIEADKAQKLKTLELKESKVKAEESAKLQEKQIAYDKELESMKLEQKKELSMIQEKRRLANQDNQNNLYQIMLVVGTVLILLILSLLLWIHRKKRVQEVKMHEETLRHEEYMQASQQHHEKITKILDIIIDEKTDKNTKKELVKFLKEQGGTPALLLEDKKIKSSQTSF